MESRRFLCGPGCLAREPGPAARCRRNQATCAARSLADSSTPHSGMAGDGRDIDEAERSRRRSPQILATLRRHAGAGGMGRRRSGPNSSIGCSPQMSSNRATKCRACLSRRPDNEALNDEFDELSLGRVAVELDRAWPLPSGHGRGSSPNGLACSGDVHRRQSSVARGCTTSARPMRAFSVGWTLDANPVRSLQSLTRHATAGRRCA